MGERIEAEVEKDQVGQVRVVLRMPEVRGWLRQTRLPAIGFRRGFTHTFAAQDASRSAVVAAQDLARCGSGGVRAIVWTGGIEWRVAAAGAGP